METKKHKGGRVDMKIFFGTDDPDMPNLCPKDLKEFFEAANQKLKNTTGKVIFFGTAGEMESNKLKSFFKLFYKS